MTRETMDLYEQKYKAAVQRAKECLKDNSIIAKAYVESIFPELAESEDERTRKKLIGFFMNWEKYIPNSPFDSDECDKILAWLEEQNKKLDPDKVIEWFEKHYRMTPDGGYYYFPKDDIKQFKKGFLTPQRIMIDLDKACEWLEQNAYLYCDDIDTLHESALIGDFRHVMTGG